MEITVRFAALQQATEDIGSSHGRLVAHKADMDAFLNNLRSTWEGGAGLNWQATQQRWNEAADGVHGVLRALGNAVEMAHANYTGAESNNERIWGV
jgi:ESAT-6 family protein